MNSATVAPKVCTTCGTRYASDALFCPSDGTPLSSNLTAEAAQPGSPDAPDPYLGREISGHIEIRQLAGVGAMGRVYRAFQKGIDRDVAVKILHRELSANQQLVARFHREAKVASRLQHPNVVQVHLAGQLPDGALYIVMEYLDGLSLQSALAAAGGAMPLARALRLALQLCDAVGEAHAQGVVHRDLKPENVMLVRRGDDADYIKVLDFGIARLNWGEQSMATAAGLIFGTARYISPEGAQGEQVGPQGDVYSIATLLFQMLSGRAPFEGDQAVALLIQQIHDAPPPLRSIPRASYVPEAIAKIVMRNLAKDPAAREPDARAIGRALLEAARETGMSLDDLVGRSGLLSKSSGAMQLAPIQATRQLQLNPEMEALLAGSPRPSNGSDSGSSPELAGSADKTGITPPPVLTTPGAPTTKWVPPPGFQARLNPPRAPMSSGVDVTMDDQPAPLSFPAARPGSTQITPAPPSSAPRAPFDSNHSRAALVSKPSSNVDTTMNDELAPRRRSRFNMVVVFVCFLVVGVSATAGVLYNMGALYTRDGQVSTATAGALDDVVLRAQEARTQKHWAEPSGDNVRELTAEGLAKWPGDPRLMEVRKRAANDLVREASARERASDVREALQLARLARELDADDILALQLVERLEAASAVPVPPLVGSAQKSALTAGPSGTQPGLTLRTPPVPGGMRVSLDAIPAKPRIGQQVELVVKLSAPNGAAPKTSAEEPHFVIAGPNSTKGTKMLALTESSGVYRGTYSFLEPGRYEVTFNGKADGIAVHTSRTIIAGDVPRPTSAAPSGDPQTPPPSPSGKWL